MPPLCRSSKWRTAKSDARSASGGRRRVQNPIQLGVAERAGGGPVLAGAPGTHLPCPSAGTYDRERFPIELRNYVVPKGIQ